MPKSRKKKKSPKRVLALPDLEQAKSAVLNTLTSKGGQQIYDHSVKGVRRLGVQVNQQVLGPTVSLSQFSGILP